MKRQIIKIDEEKCTGCGLCVKGCPEGALQIIDGKARLVGEILCDGLGACIGTCPEEAITVEEREAESYDEMKVIENIVQQGENVLAAHLKHLKDHRQDQYLQQALGYLKQHNISVPTPQEEDPKPSAHAHHGCPGMKMHDFRESEEPALREIPAEAFQSRLRQWPIQLQLLSPQAPYFQDADLVIAADCVPFAYANFHDQFLKGKTLIIFCPKLDRVHEMYIEKLAAIFKGNEIKSLTILHMEVPCCFGVGALVEQALALSGKNISVEDYTISVKGEGI